MKILISLLLVFCFSLSAFASCESKYQERIEKNFTILHKYDKAAIITTSVVTAGTVLFWGTMGVIMVGPSGVLIGLTFGAVVGAPLAAAFYIGHVIQKAVIKGKMNALNLIQYAEGMDVDKTIFLKTLSTLQKIDSSFTEMELVELIKRKNSEDAFCSNKIMGLKKVIKLLKHEVQLEPKFVHPF